MVSFSPICLIQSEFILQRVDGVAKAKTFLGSQSSACPLFA